MSGIQDCIWPGCGMKTHGTFCNDHAKRGPFAFWLEREHPSHSIYDFDTNAAYTRWREELQAAFEAGQRFEREGIGGIS